VPLRVRPRLPRRLPGLPPREDCFLSRPHGGWPRAGRRDAGASQRAAVAWGARGMHGGGLPLARGSGPAAGLR
jgi:hypothetical protein